MTPPRPALFLDRDGVVNMYRPGRYVDDIEDFVFIDGSLEAIVTASASGVPIVIVSNQAGVAKGHTSVETVEAIMANLRASVEQAGGKILDIFYCPHDTDGLCDCRKPKPGMLLAASRRHDLALEQSVMVGDSESDLDAARAAGCRAVLVLSGQSGVRGTEAACAAAAKADAVFPDLASALPWLLGALT
jgi:D-glycero-D-manno-heptose 1,7-bisphosphate phosphatase